MGSYSEQHAMALASCIEVVLTRRSNINYNSLLTKLDSLYNYKITDCYENPEYLRTVLRDTYKENYNSIIDEIKLELDELTNVEEIVDFFKIMEG